MIRRLAESNNAELSTEERRLRECVEATRPSAPSAARKARVWKALDAPRKRPGYRVRARGLLALALVGAAASAMVTFRHSVLERILPVVAKRNLHGAPAARSKSLSPVEEMSESTSGREEGEALASNVRSGVAADPAVAAAANTVEIHAEGSHVVESQTVESHAVMAEPVKGRDVKAHAAKADAVKGREAKGHAVARSRAAQPDELTVDSAVARSRAAKSDELTVDSDPLSALAPAATARTTAAESQLLLSAIHALRADHRPADARRLAEEYLQSEPDPALAEEAQFILLEAAATLRSTDFDQLAAAYRARYPRGHYRDRVRQLEEKVGGL